jgi:hypothetical protein
MPDRIVSGQAKGKSSQRKNRRLSKNNFENKDTVLEVSMKDLQSKLSRRQFLLAVGVGGASAAVARVTGNNREKPAEQGKTAREGQGYRVTEHIRNYYRTVKV